ncbi:DUF932 domain-containing protein [Rhodococcus sp. T2V]|uniref:DUF932 domain-containing protein n=1 Tax=Rhodococcus sp. T2V TaxID=3034164 RepID=UPI0023E18CF8|nr:DUF932 domain-containing protein [Rhodococcus sp. T2V]MDF3313292.1 DUF932 domain-containing protein [Rhodococcus sp. T2V]
MDCDPGSDVLQPLLTFGCQKASVSPPRHGPSRIGIPGGCGVDDRARRAGAPGAGAAVGGDGRGGTQRAATSLDGSVATTYGRTVTATVCDKTMAIALGQARGQRVKIRHSRLSGLRMEEARRALSVVEETADEFAETLRHLFSVVVSDRQWFSFLDVWYSVPEGGGSLVHDRVPGAGGVGGDVPP